MPIVSLSDKISRSKTIIYELEARTYNTSARKYPVEIDTIKIGMFSSLEKAEKEMREWIRPCPENQDEDYDIIHSFSIQELGIDVPYHGSLNDEYDERIYHDRGKLYGIVKNFREHFSGTDPEDCRFKKGDLVEFLMGSKLQIGIVASLPLSPDKVSKHNILSQRLYDEGKGITDLDGNQIPLFCDQSDNTYGIYYGRGSSMDADLQEAGLFRPKFPISARIRRRLDVKRRYENGIHTRINKINTENKYGIELNGFMLDKFKEPHVVIFDDDYHLVISLDSYKILKGNQEKFDKDEINRMVKLIKANEEILKSKFWEMVEKCKNDKAC